MERLIFSAGSEGKIRVWNVPEFQGDKEEFYRATNGVNYQVGEMSDGVAEPYWILKYHPFLNILMALKTG